MMKKLERVLKALANKRRLAIIWFLDQDDEATVGDIASEIRLSFKATSKHLSVLYAVDIVEKEQRSLNMWYRLSTTRHSLVRQTIKYISNSRE